MSIITRGIVVEDSAATLLDRISKSDGSTAIVAADFTNITVKSFDLDSGAESPVKTTSITPTSTQIVTTAIADGWNRDSIGRNVVLVLDGGHWPTGGATYQVEVTYTPAVGAPFTSIYELQAVEVFGS